MVRTRLEPGFSGSVAKACPTACVSDALATDPHRQL